MTPATVALAAALLTWRGSAWTGTVIDPWAHDSKRRGRIRYLKVDGRNLAVPCPVDAPYGTRLTLLPQVGGA